jgi:hypothetical protein
MSRCLSKSRDFWAAVYPISDPELGTRASGLPAFGAEYSGCSPTKSTRMSAWISLAKEAPAGLVSMVSIKDM